MIPALQIQFLGGFSLRNADTSATPLDHPRLQVLLAYLVLYRARPHTRQHLAFLLWPDSSEAQARSNLRSLLHRLRHALPEAIDAFLAEHGLGRDDIEAWVTHPGGPKIIDAVEEGLDLHQGELEPARQGLAQVGNLSSASVLFLLDDYRKRLAPRAGAFGLMLAMGPAFCAELVLLRW